MIKNNIYRSWKRVDQPHENHICIHTWNVDFRHYKDFPIKNGKKHIRRIVISHWDSISLRDVQSTESNEWIMIFVVRQTTYITSTCCVISLRWTTKTDIAKSTKSKQKWWRVRLSFRFVCILSLIKEPTIQQKNHAKNQIRIELGSIDRSSCEIDVDIVLKNFTIVLFSIDFLFHLIRSNSSNSEEKLSKPI